MAKKAIRFLAWGLAVLVAAGLAWALAGPGLRGLPGQSPLPKASGAFLEVVAAASRQEEIAAVWAEAVGLTGWAAGFLRPYFSFLNGLMLSTAFVILSGSLDDFFIDLCYWTRRVYRRLTVAQRYAPLRVEDLRRLPEKPIAVMVPCWRESQVITRMIEGNLKFIDYHNYIFFIGAYRNDPETILEIDRMVQRYPAVKKVVVPHDGPTCKADCLNWIVQAISLHEKNTGIQFAMAAMHDSEDIIHPLEFRMFNYLVPRKDLIQIPVRGLESRWFDFVRGVYVDEFAEYHNKEMAIREALTGVVPSAGVASCFSRRALEALRSDGAVHVFNPDTLTEDYDISFRLASSHPEMRQVFVTFPVTVSLRKSQTAPTSYVVARDKRIPIAVSEYFPNRFWQSVRQKTRWNIGIFFQAAGRVTWSGGLWRKYFFFHDRKGVITNLIVLPAYFLLANIAAFAVAGTLFGLPYRIFELPPWLVYVSTGLMLNRAAQRMYFTAYLYNWREGLLSLLRIPVSNAVNFCSTLRAVCIYLKFIVTGRPIAWDKTQHEYPSLEILEHNYKRLGEALVEMGKIDEESLKDALAEQDICRASLGRLLVGKGTIGLDELLDILCAQMNCARGDPSEAEPQRALELLPLELILAHGVYPVSQTERGALRIFATRPLPPEILTAALSGGYAGVEPLVINDAAMERLLEQLQTREAGSRKLGDILAEKNLITAEELQAALRRQSLENRFLGDLLLDDGLINHGDLRAALTEQTGCQAVEVEINLDLDLVLSLLHPSIIMAYRVFPCGLKEEGPGDPVLLLYITQPLTGHLRNILLAQGYTDVEPRLILKSEMESLIKLSGLATAGGRPKNPGPAEKPAFDGGEDSICRDE